MTDRHPHTSALRAATFARVTALVRAIREGDETKVKDAVLRLSESRRVLAPLAFIVGAFAMLFEGLKLLVSNWRLTLVQVLPAMWIWIAMVDLKAHVLHGKSFLILRGPILIPVVGLITAVTAASFFLNAVFAFAIATPGPPQIRPAVTLAWSHRGLVLAWGAGIGLALGLSTVVVDRWGRGWFAVSLSVVIGVMMFLLRRGAVATRSRPDPTTTLRPTTPSRHGVGRARPHVGTKAP